MLFYLSFLADIPKKFSFIFSVITASLGGRVSKSQSQRMVLKLYPQSIAYFNQTVGDRVLFVVDQSTLSDEGRAVLDGQAGWLTANPDYAIIIEGHADEQGTREYNLSLGARRAAAVQDYLISQGVPAGRMRTVSYGKERPIEVCSTESCYSQNRRSVTVLSMGAGA